MTENRAVIRPAVDRERDYLQTVQPKLRWQGGDLAVWQEQARQKLAELLGMNRFERVDPKTEIEFERHEGNATELRFTYQSEEGYRVPCHLFLPDGIEKPPVIICLQGHSTGMHISMGKAKYERDAELIKGGDRDFCVRAVQEGYAAIAMEQRNFGECGGTDKGPKCLESSMTALLCGRTTIGERVWDISRLIDVLEREFAAKVDTSKICCMGNSGGGTATAYVAALEERIVLAMPSCAMCTYQDSIGAMYHCTCNYVPHIAEYFDMGDLLAMACPKYYVQVNGAKDPIFPIQGARSVFAQGKNAYEADGCADRCKLVEGDGGHRFYADDAWPVVHNFMKTK